MERCNWALSLYVNGRFKKKKKLDEFFNPVGRLEDNLISKLAVTDTGFHRKHVYIIYIHCHDNCGVTKWQIQTPNQKQPALQQYFIVQMSFHLCRFKMLMVGKFLTSAKKYRNWSSESLYIRLSLAPGEPGQKCWLFALTECFNVR